MAGVKKSKPRSKRANGNGRAPRAARPALDTVFIGGNAWLQQAVLRLLQAQPQVRVAGTASTAAEAGALIESRRPALALVDLNLPDRSGLELARELKRRRAGPRVVLIASTDDSEYREAAAAAGVDALFSRDDLVRALPAWLKSASAGRGPAPDARPARKAARPGNAEDERAWNRFRSTFNQAAVGILHATTEGWILEVNRALCEMLGYSSNELRTMNTRQLTHPEDRDRQDAQRLELVKGLRSSFSAEKRYLRKDGAAIWVNRTVTVGYEAPGAAPYLINTIEDITERKRAELALQQSQARFADLMNSVDGIVWEGDARTLQFTFVSRQAEKLLGYPVSRWIEEPTFWADHIHPEDREWALDFCITATREMRPHDFEYRMIAADGRVVWLRDIVSVVIENGKPVLSRGVMVDITAAKQAEMDARRHGRARRVLAECSRALAHASDEVALLREMCQILVDSGGYVQAHIGLAMNDERKTVYPVASAGYETGYLESKDLRWGGEGAPASMTGQVIASGERYISRDLLFDPRAGHLAERARSRGFRSQIGLPLTVNGKCVGAISIYAREADSFDDEEVALLGTLADDISFGMAGLRARAAQQRMAGELERVARARRVMAECSHALVHAASEAELLNEMCRIIVEAGGYQQGWIGLPGDDGGHIVRPAAHAGYVADGPGSRYLTANEEEVGVSVMAMRSGETTVVKDILSLPAGSWRRERALAHGFQSSIALPLKGEEQTLGVLVMHAPEPDAFGQEEIALLETLAGDIAFGLANLRMREARREAEQRLREVFDQAAVGIIHTDLTGVLVEVNQKFCELLGCEREELLGKTVKDITHPDDYGTGRQLREEVQRGGQAKSLSGEKRFLRKDGSAVWTKRTMSAAYDAAGAPKYLISIVEDITGQKELERLNRETFEQAAVGIVHNALDGRYLRVNRKFCEMLGYAEDELVGKNADLITHPEDLDESRANRARLAGGEMHHQAGEKRYVRKDGRVIWVRRTASVARDEAGKPMYVIRVIEDITERKTFEQQFQATFDQAAVGIVHTALDGRYLRVNRKLCEITGYTAEELTAPKAPRMSHPDDIESGGGQRRKLMAGEISSHSNEKRYVRKDGRTIWVNRTESLARDAAGQPLYFIRVIEDITERKELEHQFRDNFDQAAVGMAHVDLEANTIIRVNRKFCELTGYDEADLVGGPAARPSHPDDVNVSAAERTQLLAGAVQSHGSEKRYRRKDGATIWVKRTESLARDADGKPAYLIRVIEDVTDRRQAEEAILRERALLRTIIDTLPDRIYVKDREGRFLLENAANLRVHGIENHDEIVGKTVFDLFPRAVAERLHAEDQAIMESGAPIFNRERSTPDASTGRMLWHLTTKVPLRDAAGAIIGVVGLNRDITERRNAEEMMARERALLRTVVDNLPDRVYVKDLQGRYLLMNEANMKQRGIARHEDVVGKTVRDFYSPQTAKRIDDLDRQVMESGQPVVNREEQTSPTARENRDGEPRWHVVTKVPLRDTRGKVFGLVGVNRDITERKRMEEALRQNIERFEIAARATSDAIWDWSLATDAMWWNEGFRSLFGYSPTKPNAESWYDGIHPADRERAVRGIHAAIDGGGESWSDEYRFLRADGSYAEVFDRGFVIRDGTGKPVRMIGAMMDVTERNQSMRRRAMELAVTRVLAEAASLEEASPKLLRVVCETMGWVYGARWACEADDAGMRRADYWAESEPDFDPGDAGHWVRQGGPDASKSLLRRAWAVREPTWVADFRDTPNFLRGSSTRKLGLRSALAFPVIVGGKVVSLLEFFGRDARQPDQALLDVARSIGSQVGQFIERKQSEAALKDSEEQFRQLAENIPQVFWITDAEQQQALYVSPAWQEITGRSLEDIRANPRTWLDSVHEEDRARVKSARKLAVAGGYDENFRVVRPDGSVRWVHDRAFPVHGADGSVYRITGIAEDVTERKQAETQLVQLAHYDVLTGLPNRLLFYDRLRQSLAQARRNQWNVGVMFIDVDRFKNVNDTLGHAVGDRLLQQVAGRLSKAVRAEDTVGRLGGDEFAMVLSNLTSAQDASVVANKIMASFNEPFALEGAEIYVSASVGITLFPDDSVDQDTLIRNADAAMYRAKELGRNNFQFYTPEMNTRAHELLVMENSLRRALDRAEFLLQFQPKASTATGEITGVEALLRWRHPERGLVSPADFIPVLEDTGLIVPVGEWVIAAACEQVRDWQRAGIQPVPVAVNLSARQFQSPRLGAAIVAAIEASGIDPRYLELEITESSLMQNAEGAVGVLRQLKERGIRISIDDFGTGYSSLGYLKRFPLDALKVDRSFVRDVTRDADDATITRAVILMAHSLGLKVIAEGVETAAQLQFLSEYGCDEIQGYFFSRPLSGEDCGAWLREGRRLARSLQPEASAPVVLLVDDDDDALTLLKRTLAKDGYNLLTARNAHEALEVLGAQRVDVVISDQHMPGVQGVDFLERVKRLHPRVVRLMTSGDSDAQTVTDAINKSEIFRFLPKGMNEERMRADVRDALRSRTAGGRAGLPGQS